MYCRGAPAGADARCLGGGPHQIKITIPGNEIGALRAHNQHNRLGATIGVVKSGVTWHWLETMRGARFAKWPKVGLGSFSRVSNPWFTYLLIGMQSSLVIDIYTLSFPYKGHLL